MLDSTVVKSTLHKKDTKSAESTLVLASTVKTEAKSNLDLVEYKKKESNDPIFFINYLLF